MWRCGVNATPQAAERANPPIREELSFVLDIPGLLLRKLLPRSFSGKGPTMSAFGRGGRRCLLTVALGLCLPATADAACCYFSAQNADILQPAQKVFITWDPVKQLESFTVQPKFEGNALDFGMVIPTPTQPKLHEMPRDFFKHLAVFSILKRREVPYSKLLPLVYSNRREA